MVVFSWIRGFAPGILQKLTNITRTVVHLAKKARVRSPYSCTKLY